MKHLGRFGLWQATDGVSSIEFAIVGSFLTFLLLGTLDFGMLFFQEMQIANAAQAGADYAMAHAYNATNVTSAAQGATNLSAVTVNPSTMLCGCPGTSGISSASCGAACPGAGTGTATGYVRVQANVSYRTVFPWFSTNPVTLSSTAYAICQNTTCS